MLNNKEAQVKSSANITIDLSTRSAARVFKGREKTSKKFGILGIPGFAKIMKIMEVAAGKDDPYADYYLVVIEEAIASLKIDLENVYKELEEFVSSSVPEEMTLPKAINENPETITIRFASRSGFKMTYLLITLDKIILKALNANHVGLINNKEKFKMIAHVEGLIRSVLHKVFDYKFTGVTRDDIAGSNKVAQNAIEQMGVLKDEYLTGTKRAEDAPNLPTKRMNIINKENILNKDNLKEIINNAIADNPDKQSEVA